MVQRKLFPNQADTAKAIRKPIGKGYSLGWQTDTLLSIYRYGVPYKTTQIKAAIDKRILVVDLIIDGGVTKSALADALGVSRQSIDNWIDTFKKSGYEGLVNSYKGGRERERGEHAQKLPRGNKARQLEEERRRKREEEQKRQLAIEFDTKQKSAKAEAIFNETYPYEENRYAGSFIYWGIFQHLFDVMDLCESYLGSYCLVVYLFAMMLVQGISSVEQLKGVFKREFGKIIGIRQLLSKPRLWEMIHAACILRESRSLIQGFFDHLARKSLVALTWLYIDGHFIPYYGNERIHKGYYTQRDQMMPGQTEIFVHDFHGHIVYFDLQEGKGDLKGMMRTMSNLCAPYLGGTPPLIVADREVWGVEHFLTLTGCRFVTWEKWSDAQELSSISDTEFGPSFELNGKEYKAHEKERTYRDDKGNSITLRRIVIWNKETGKRAACVAQDELEDTTTIAIAMLSRWGCSENSFKHMGEQWQMHYNPVVEMQRESEHQEIPNPHYKSLKQKLADLKAKLAHGERKLGRLPLTVKKDGSLRKNSTREKLTKQREELHQMIAQAEEDLDHTKETIQITNPEERFKQLDTEGKNLWDVSQALVWNARKKLIEMLREFLPNPRDLIPVLDAITKGRGWIRSTSEALEVRLEPLDIPRFKAAQIQLCRALNEKDIRFKNGKRLLFDVGGAPDILSKNSTSK